MILLLGFAVYLFLVWFTIRFVTVCSDPCEGCSIRSTCTPEHKQKCKGVFP